MGRGRSGGNSLSAQKFKPSRLFSAFSILIFMALKNSKTGSLPVSEIYNFMTEHFPYFKVSQRSTRILPPRVLGEPGLSEPEGSAGR